MNSKSEAKVFREGGYTFRMVEPFNYYTNNNSSPEYGVEDEEGEVIGKVVRIRYYGLPGFLQALTPSGRIVGRYSDWKTAGEALARKRPE